ncbi:MAG TPA: 30S ribosomal protein S13 [archaeon]|nr:30S ribosomal protein S13 [archaeon]
MDKKEKPQHRGNPRHMPEKVVELSPEDKDLRLIVRIAGIDVDGRKPISRALTKIKGIGVRMAKNIAVAFELSSNIPSSQKIGKISEEDSKKLEEVVYNPEKFGVPVWSLNRRKDFYTGLNSHLVMSDLDLTLRSDVQRMTETKSYKGLRHAWGLPVRGQSTRSTHHKKGGVVGVVRKDATAQAAPAKATAGAKATTPAKKEEKKK